jgi:allantoin racemase
MTPPRPVAVLNPNATAAMTDAMVDALRGAPGGSVAFRGLTNREGPPAIQGEADAADALPGLFALFDEAVRSGAGAAILGCFDDTGLAALRARGTIPVIGLGEAGCLLAGLAAPRFGVVTTLAVSVPAIERNIRAMGLWERCAGVRASGVPVLGLEAGADRVAEAAAALRAEAPGCAVVLGCAGMTAIAPRLRAALSGPLIDPVTAAGALACGLLAQGGHGAADPEPAALSGAARRA